MAIISADAPNQTCVAYRPILIYGEDNGASGYCNVMYCDVYFDGVFYKTLSSYSPFAVFGLSGTVTIFRFDLQALAQEYIKTQVYNITKTGFDDVYHNPSLGTSVNRFGMTMCTCYIRNSFIDGYGRVIPETPVPVQGTIDSAPIAGGGTLCTPTSFNIINATLQATDMQQIEQQLHQTRIGTSEEGPITPNSATYPLSYARKIKVYATDWGRFPFYNKDLVGPSGLPGASSRNCYFRLNMVKEGVGLIYSFASSVSVLYANSAYTIPYGIPNLTNYFAGIGAPIPAFLWKTIDYYFITVETYSLDYNLMHSPRIYIEPFDGVSPAYTAVINDANPLAQFVPKHTRIWFRNYLGQLEALNFTERTETLKVTSTPKERALIEGSDASNNQYAFYQSLGRSNVRSNDYSTATGLFNEEDMLTIKQLLGSSLAFVEFTSPVPASGATNPAAKLMPIVILDDQVDTLVWDDRFEYRVSIKYINSNENILIR